MKLKNIANSKYIRTSFVVTLGVFQILLGQFDNIYASVSEAVPQIWIFTIKPLVVVGQWAGLWGFNPTWSVWLYGMVLIGIGVAAFVQFSRNVKLLSVAFFVANLSLYWLLYLWSGWGTVGEYILGDIGYTLLMGIGIALFFVASPEPRQPNRSRSEGSPRLATAAGGTSESYPSASDTSTEDPGESAIASQASNESNREIGADANATQTEQTDTHGSHSSQQANMSRAEGTAQQAGVGGEQADLVSLADDEQVLGNVTFYWSNWWKQILLATFLFGMGLVLIVRGEIENGPVIGLALVLVSFGMFVLIYRAREKSGCVITTKRIVLSKAQMLAVKTTEVRMRDIRSIITTQSGMQSLLDTGNVKVDTGAGDINIGARNVEELAAVIRREKNRQADD